MTTYELASSRVDGWKSVTKLQWLVLITTFLAWGLDGFDGNIFSLVIGPAMKDLLTGSSVPVTPHAIALYGGLNITIFLVGWSLGSLLFGLLADYFGRVRVLTWSIVIYAVFTFACAFAANWYELAIFRFLGGIGSGVEWPVGAALIAETWNNRLRAKAAGIMMAGFAFGFFLSSFAFKYSAHVSAVFGFHQSWRGLYLLGIIPALLVFLTRGKMHEPASFEQVKLRRQQVRNIQLSDLSESDRRYKRFVLFQLFKPPYTKDTWLAIGMSIGGLFAFWAITGFTPSVIRQILAAHGVTGDAATPLIANGSMMLYIGGLVGYAVWGFIADIIGRKKATAMCFILTLFGSLYVYPFVRDYNTLLWLLPIVGLGVFSFFSASAVYFAELFDTEVRTTAISIANNVGRFITSPGPFIVGFIYALFGDYGIATAVVSGTVIISLVLLIWARETYHRDSDVRKSVEVSSET